jgi:O-antigen/teichoic acid export membrane protein
LITAATGTAVVLLVVLLANWLATRVLQEPEIASYLRLGAPLLFFSAINGVQMGTLTGFECFRTMTIGRVVMAALALPLLVAGVLLGGIRGVLIGQLVLSCVSFVWFRVALTRQSRVWGVVTSYRDAWQENSVLWSFAVPALLSGIVYMPVIWAANAILVRSPNGLAEMGMFNAAAQWRNLIIWIPGALGQVALPILTSLISEGDRTRFGKALRLNILVNVLLGLAAAIPISLCSYWILSLYGPEFSSRWLALVMLSGAAVLQATINVIGQVIASTSRMWWGFFLNMLWAFELLIATWLLVRYGANGLGTAYFVAYLLHLVQVAAYTAWVLRYDTRIVGTTQWSSDIQQSVQPTD